MKRMKVLAIAVTMALVLALLLPATALATVVPGETVPTTATITGSGSPPIIKAQWELPDDYPAIAGTQVDIVPSGTKMMYAYIVVMDPNGRGDIAQVFCDVYHPDGTFKFQVHGVLLDPTVSDDMAEMEEAKAAGVAAETGTWTTNVPEMLLDPTLAPVPAEPITQDVADWLDEEIFNTETAYMYKAEIPMEYHQPCGRYTVESWATDQSGEQSLRLGSWYEWVETKVLELDFTSIDYGEVVPCIEKIVPGDYVLETAGPAPPVKPTVKNEGNIALTIGVHSTAMVGDATGKTIEDFDTKFRDEKIQYVACEDTWFANPLDLCSTEKIIFSVHAPVGTPSDTYRGELTMLVG